MIGKEILGYHVDEKIGSGGFGTVYKVSKTNASGTYVRALKHITLPTKKQYISVLNSMGGDYAKADDYFAGALRDIVNEIQILSSLSEAGVTNIVRYYENDIIETPSPRTYDIYILMEFLTPLDTFIESRDFTVRDVIKLGRDILGALISCHDKKIIHRDIKDDNIFVGPDGEFKLGDFGVSKSLKDKSRAESVKGTPNFIAPEVYLGKEKYDNTVDIYSLGIVLYKLLNRSRNPFMPAFPAPYNTDDEDAAFEARMTGRIPALPIMAENMLGEAILKAIMPRESRYDTAAEFLEALINAEATLDDEYLVSIVCEAVEGIPMHNDTEKIKTEKSLSDKTVGIDYLNSCDDERSERDRHLFDTMSSQPQTVVEESGPVPESEVRPVSEQGRENTQSTERPQKTTESVPKTEPMQKTDNGGDQNKKKADVKKIVTFALPPIFLLIYVALYMVLIPIFYGETLSFIHFLAADVDHILRVLRDVNNILVPGYVVVLFIIFQYLILSAFVASLIRVAVLFQKPKTVADPTIKYTGKQPSVLLENIRMSLIRRGLSDTARELQYAIDIMKYGKGFGADNIASVVNIEKEICDAIDKLNSGIGEMQPEELLIEVDELRQKIVLRETMLKK